MDDEALWHAFTTYKLSHEQWTHAAHLRTAFLFLRRYPLDEAHLRLRAGIIRLNERHGLVESSSRGYFETLTRVWLVLVASAQERCLAPDSRALLQLCPELWDRSLPLRHYSKERLMSCRTRAIFLEPDLVPLPEIGPAP